MKGDLEPTKFAFFECLPKRLLERQVLSIPDEPMADHACVHGREIGRHVVIIEARDDEQRRRFSWLCLGIQDSVSVDELRIVHPSWSSLVELGCFQPIQMKEWSLQRCLI